MKRKYFYRIFVVIAIVSIAYSLIDPIKAVMSGVRYHVVIDSSLDAEYGKLFKSDLVQKITDIRSIKNKGRNTISKFKYNLNYDFIVYKFSSGHTSNMNLFKIVNHEQDVSTSANYVYRMSTQPNILMHYSANASSDLRQVEFFGRLDSMQIVKADDSTLCYRFGLHNLALVNHASGLNDIVLESNPDRPNNNEVPIVEFAIVNRNNSSYVIVLSSVSGNSFMKNADLSILLH